MLEMGKYIVHEATVCPAVSLCFQGQGCPRNQVEMTKGVKGIGNTPPVQQVKMLKTKATALPFWPLEQEHTLNRKQMDVTRAALRKTLVTRVSID